MLLKFLDEGANSVDPDQTPFSDLGLHYLLIAVFLFA